MVISSQARPKCREGSETRSHVLNGLCANLSVEFKGYEGPRAPGNQKVQQVWSDENCIRVLRDEAAMQAVSSCDMRALSAGESAENKTHVARLVFEKQRSSIGKMQGIQRQTEGQGT